MTVVSNDNKTRMRYPYHRIRRAVLNIYPVLDKVRATATVGDLTGLTYPIADIPVTGATADWSSTPRGTYYRITDGSGNFVADGIWRKFADNQNDYLYALGFSRGDSGIAVEQAIALAAGQTITLYTVRIPKVYPSRIDSATLYKRWDLEFSSVSPSAQANLGKHQQADIDPDTGLARLTLSAAGSSSWVGGTLTYNWAEPDGATLVAGYASTDETIEMDYVPGAYLQRCTVDDSASQQEASFRYIFINGDDGLGNSYTAFSDQYKVTAITMDIEDLRGREMTFEAMGSDISTALITGAPALFTYIHEHSADKVNWETFDQDLEPNNFFGYVRSFETISDDGNGVQTVRFTISSPIIYAETLPFAQQHLIVNASPSEWWHLPASLSNAAFVPYYVMDLHSRWMTEINDYLYGDADLYYKHRWNIDANNMADACRKAAKPFLGNFGCRSDGTFLLQPNPQYETDANRNAVDTVMAITDADMFPPVQYQRNEIMQNRETEGGAFIYSGEGESAKIKGVKYRTGSGAPMQGVGIATMPDFVALNTIEAPVRVGHYHQRLNAPTPTISFKMPGSHNAFNLATMEWWELDVASYDPMERGLWSNRILPVRVTRNWNMIDDGLILEDMDIVAEPETYGQPAVNKTSPIWRGQGITPQVISCYSWDFTETESWAIESSIGAYDSGGYYSDNPSNASVWISFAAGAQFMLKSATFHFSDSWTGTNPRITLYTDSGFIHQDGAGGVDVEMIYNTTFAAGEIQFQFTRNRLTGTQLWGALRLTGITLEIVGANPMGASNC